MQMVLHVWLLLLLVIIASLSVVILTVCAIEVIEVRHHSIVRRDVISVTIIFGSEWISHLG